LLSKIRWKQIAKKGWRIQEPNDNLLLEESSVFLKEPVDLIIDHQVKTKQHLCEELALNQSDIETLANLTKGYLSPNDNNNNILSF
jgi:hypothetical protein